VIGFVRLVRFLVEGGLWRKYHLPVVLEIEIQGDKRGFRDMGGLFQGYLF
jgi:hypothetical protein